MYVCMYHVFVGIKDVTYYSWFSKANHCNGGEG